MDSKNPHYGAKVNTPIQWTAQMKDLKIMPRNLNIMWGNDSHYWHMPDSSKWDSPAELIQVNWLEVTGSAILSPGKWYEIGFTVSLSDDAFGWNNVQVYIMAKLGKKGSYARKKVSILNSLNKDGKFDIKIQILHNSNENTAYFGLYEVWSGRWKGGLQIHSAFIRSN